MALAWAWAPSVEGLVADTCLNAAATELAYRFQDFASAVQLAWLKAGCVSVLVVWLVQSTSGSS